MIEDVFKRGCCLEDTIGIWTQPWSGAAERVGSFWRLAVLSNHLITLPDSSILKDPRERAFMYILLNRKTKRLNQKRLNLVRQLRCRRYGILQPLLCCHCRTACRFLHYFSVYIQRSNWLWGFLRQKTAAKSHGARRGAGAWEGGACNPGYRRAWYHGYQSPWGRLASRRDRGTAEPPFGQERGVASSAPAGDIRCKWSPIKNYLKWLYFKRSVFIMRVRPREAQNFKGTRRCCSVQAALRARAFIQRLKLSWKICEHDDKVRQ